jgi:hypothetical protein
VLSKLLLLVVAAAAEAASNVINKIENYYL